MKIPAHTERDPYLIIKAIQDLAQGRNNATGDITLAVNQTQTTVNNPCVTERDCILLSPTNAAAVSAGWFVSSASKGSFVVGHTSSAAPRTFRYVVLGG